MPRFSIVICCHNSAGQIQPTLEHLMRCELPEAGEAELIIVDNNCTDATVDLVMELWDRGDIPLRIVKEFRPGLSFAREAGMGAASGNFYVLVDDDNWLDPNYLVKANEVLQAHPEVGILGGIGSLPDTTTFPDWLVKYMGRYALGPCQTFASTVNFVYGAGMVIRAEVLQQLKQRGFQSYLTDRSGLALSSGGDSEICYAAKLLGWSIWREPKAVFTHSIPQDRMTEEYLLRLTKGIGESLPVLSVYFYYHRFDSKLLVCLVSLASFLKHTCFAFLWLLLQNMNKALYVRERVAIHSGIVKAWWILAGCNYLKVMNSAKNLKDFSNSG